MATLTASKSSVDSLKVRLKRILGLIEKLTEVNLLRTRLDNSMLARLDSLEERVDDLEVL